MSSLHSGRRFWRVYIGPKGGEKYVSALGQSPEGFALMKTDPLRLGSKVSKIESPQKVGTNFLLEFFLSPLTLAERIKWIKWNQITMKKCDKGGHLVLAGTVRPHLAKKWDGTAAACRHICT